jgi:sigma-70-like protein
MRGQLCSTGAGRCTVALWLPAGTPPALAGPAAARPDTAAEAAEREALMAALRSLPRRQREVLVLRYYADLDAGEVAQILRIGPSTVRSVPPLLTASVGGMAAVSAAGMSSPPG